MTVYSVHQLAEHAGISVRTLHHYDAIGLLTPSRMRNGYRQYAQEEVLRLQQILFFRELGFSLKDIGQILSRPDFSVVRALEEHRTLLQKREERIQSLLETVDKTIRQLRGEMEMNIREYYRGFSDEQVEAYRREARERYGEKAVDESEQRVLNMGTNKFMEVQAEADNIYREIVKNMGKGPESKEVQKLVEQWRNWLEKFHHYTSDMLLGLGRLYSQDPRFAAYFRNYHGELPEFFTRAIEHYCSGIPSS